MLGFQHWPEATGLLSYLKRNTTEVAEVGSTPFEIVAEAGSLSLKRFCSLDGAKLSGLQKSPVLIIPSFINRSYILDLLPEKSFVRHLLNAGHEVYMIEWGIPKSAEENLSLDSLFTIYLRYLFESAYKLAGQRKLHLVGHCIGGTVSVVLSLLYPSYFQSLALLTTPVNFKADNKLSRWVTDPHFDLSAYTKASGSIPWASMQATFLMLKPTQLWQRGETFLKKQNDKKFLRGFLAMETWINDNVNMRAKLFEFILQDLYRSNSLVEGELLVDGKKLSLGKLELPVFVLKSDEDHIVPISSHLTSEMAPLILNYKAMTSQGGHVGALIGSRAQKSVWPELTSWLHQCESIGHG